MSGRCRGSGRSTRPGMRRRRSQATPGRSDWARIDSIWLARNRAPSWLAMTTAASAATSMWGEHTTSPPIGGRRVTQRAHRRIARATAPKWPGGAPRPRGEQASAIVRSLIDNDARSPSSSMAANSLRRRQVLDRVAWSMLRHEDLADTRRAAPAAGSPPGTPPSTCLTRSRLAPGRSWPQSNVTMAPSSHTGSPWTSTGSRYSRPEGPRRTRGFEVTSVEIWGTVHTWRPSDVSTRAICVSARSMSITCSKTSDETITSIDPSGSDGRSRSSLRMPSTIIPGGTPAR